MENIPFFLVLLRKVELKINLVDILDSSYTNCPKSNQCQKVTARGLKQVIPQFWSVSQIMIILGAHRSYLD